MKNREAIRISYQSLYHIKGRSAPLYIIYAISYLMIGKNTQRSLGEEEQGKNVFTVHLNQLYTTNKMKCSSFKSRWLQGLLKVRG